MSSHIHLETITDLSKMLPVFSVRHPQIAVIDFAKYDAPLDAGVKITAGFYCIMFKNFCANKVKYGQNTCDFQDGSLICIAPRQVLVLDEPVDIPEDAGGWGLFFHPDLIRGTSLGRTIREYSFFSYETNEALHLSDKEKHALRDCVQKIDQELSENIDKHSQSIIVSTLELLLNYCSRYYDRQFITRKNANRDLLVKVEAVLTEYFQSPDLHKTGLPSVKYLAERVHLSPNYLSDLLKRETGMNAQDRIHYYLIEESKNLLLGTEKSVGELAFALGFEYPQYFSRLFKSKTGMTPIEFRQKN